MLRELRGGTAAAEKLFKAADEMEQGRDELYNLIIHHTYDNEIKTFLETEMRKKFGLLDTQDEPGRDGGYKGPVMENANPWLRNQNKDDNAIINHYVIEAGLDTDAFTRFAKMTGDSEVYGYNNEYDFGNSKSDLENILDIDGLDGLIGTTKQPEKNIIIEVEPLKLAGR